MFKVVTADLKSLGLRKNPTILQYYINRWTKEKHPVKGFNDIGGIWCCHKLSSAKGLCNYMLKKYRKKCKIFKCKIGNVLFKNSYRLKTDKIKLVAGV